MAKRYDPIMCMMVDEPAKAQDEILFYQLRFSSGRTEGAKLDESEIRSYAEAFVEQLEKQGIKAITTAAADPLNKGSVMYRVEWN